MTSAYITVGTSVTIPEYPGAATRFTGTVEAVRYEYHHGHGEERYIFDVRPAEGGDLVHATFEDGIEAKGGR